MKLLLTMLLFASAAIAQPTEQVTVTAARTRQAIDGFVQSYVSPTRITEKVARWETGICPRVMGLPPALSDLVVARLKAVAQEAGAPVGPQGCRANIDIVFTIKPQALLDDVRAHTPNLLGYFNNHRLQQEAAIVRRPIQAWYVTETVDVRGQHFVDSLQGGGLELQISPKEPPVFIPHAHAVAAAGTRLGDGLRSDFYHVLIVADVAPLRVYEKDSIADYIAMLALSQPAALDCLALPSVLNLLTDSCGRRADALTDNDRAFLQGLYAMSPDSNLRVQEDQVSYHMQQSLMGK